MNSYLRSGRRFGLVAKMTLFVGLCVATWAGAGETPATRALAAEPSAAPASRPAVAKTWDEITLRYGPGDVAKWKTVDVDGSPCLVSPVLERPAGDELNHYRVNVACEGTGSAEFSVVHAGTPDLAGALKLPYLRSPFTPIKSGQEMPVTSPYKGECCSWLLLRASGDVKVRSVQFSCWHAKGALYGHVARTFDFDGGTLRYRLMVPKNYDSSKSYPLVLSVSGSGGVGSDNASSLEMVILGRYLFTHYYSDGELECFSLVPQIPAFDGIPPGYFPKGAKGKPIPPYHPDWPAVNETGWYAQATLALIQNLLNDPALKIDPNRVYFTGFSYGGKGCWEFLKAGRDVFAAALCGAGWPIGPVGSSPEGPMAERLKLEVQRYKHIPVMIFAGGNDPMMRPGSQAVSKEILAQGGKATYVEFPGVEHVYSADPTWGNRKNLLWLFQQNRANNPKPGPDPFPNGEYEAASRPAGQ
jgi:dienelactone hydrolase